MTAEAIALSNTGLQPTAAERPPSACKALGKYKTLQRLPQEGCRPNPGASVDGGGVRFTSKSLYTFKIKFDLSELNFHMVF